MLFLGNLYISIILHHIKILLNPKFSGIVLHYREIKRLNEYKGTAAKYYYAKKG
jgi:hypothetical protein